MKKLTRIDALYFSQNETGTVVSRFTNDVDAIESMFTSGVVGMVIDLLKTVGIIVSMWIFSPRLGILTVLLIPALFAMTRFFQRRMLKAQMKSRVIIGRMNNHISESIKSIQMIKSFSKEAYMEKNYEKCLDDNYRTQEKINFFDSVYSPIIQISRSAVIVAVVLLSQGRISLSGLSVGMLQMILFAVGLIVSVAARKIRSVLPVSLGLVFFFYAISAFAVTSDSDKLRFLTPFQYFKPEYVVEHGSYEMAYLVTGLVIIAVCISASYMWFRKKEIHAV